MDDRPNKPSKRKPAKSAQPSHEEKVAMMAELEKARLKDERSSVQPTPLEPPPHFEPPVGDLGNSAPPLNDFPSNEAAASNVDLDRYDYGGCYGGYQATRFNSSLLDDRECDARAEYIHHASGCIPSAPGYVGSYSASFTVPNAHMAKAIVHPTPRPRERAQCRKRSIECSIFWRVLIVPRVPPPSPFSRL
jgi:hypothetical protein